MLQGFHQQKASKTTRQLTFCNPLLVPFSVDSFGVLTALDLPKFEHEWQEQQGLLWNSCRYAAYAHDSDSYMILH